jgi:hypothetical protein
MATDVQGKKESSNTGSPWKNDFSLGVEVQKYYYKEPDIQQQPYQLMATWMDDTAYLFGINGSYRLTWKESFFVQPEGRLLYGKEDYRTGEKDTRFYTKKKTPVWLIEPRLVAGRKIKLTPNLFISPYTGIGYRFKNDDSEEVKCNDGTLLGYYRKSNYVYMPCGTYVDYIINDTWSISLKGEYDLLLKGWQYSRTLTSTSTIFKQKNGYGLKGEISVAYQHNKLKFSVSPYINYWNIRNSKRSYVWDRDVGGWNSREPYNVTFESGMRLGVSF